MTKFPALICLLLINNLMNAQEWTTPIIEGYGKIKYYENTAVQPDSTLDYHLVFDIKDIKEKDGVNAGLFKIARTLNMLGAAKISPDKIKIVAALHGEATYISLNAEKYQEKYGRSNPNAELIHLLKEYGVDIFVCAQATASRDIAAEDLSGDVELALSALSVLSNYQLKGFVLMP